MEGSLSLGVYAKGKLIRTLQKAASAEKDFTVGLNGLITHWDGKDEAGAPAPPGKYAFRGYCVGSLEVTGEAFHGNDWITDEESPRIGEIVSIQALPDDRLGVNARLADGAPVAVICDANGAVTRIEHLEPFPPVPDLTGLPELTDPVSACAGRDQSVWVIDRAPGGVEVKQYSREKELLRHLAVEPGEPEPKQITASLTKETFYLLETKPGQQVVRGLTLEAPAEPAAAAPDGPKHSVWTTFLFKQILAGDSFAAVADRLGHKQFKAEEKITVRLLPNPLFQDAATSVDLQIGFDEKGSFLRTADGLFLWPLTETPRLRWVAFGHDGNSKALTIFQYDGAAVEEFRVRKLANMMAFDAGDYELKR
jgi:hypothetical protein